MKTQAVMLVLFVSVAPMALAIAQSPQEPMSRGANLPRLGDIMIAKQWRHMKLWFAGKQHNWKLAAYESAQMRASLAEAATLYSGIPVNDVAIMAGPIQSIDKAIQSKDSAGFMKAFNELTAGCNACHRDMGREFIEVRLPEESPFSNQLFAAPTKR
ncbi:hypothetical protein HAP47_0036845 [Bradyrhizobium sp. 41S5]|uniref:hypothetical protein n=1 Tax=Bradyrhizobium sp. 41S5 TaxID=1404443 RepID=UPI00156B263E|nr:hypothetical protein [Bradyrhizobium sp. 41S5]UFX44487.1 hypothetical protein HAP47_0036845 [Bradyrhizobium sp. 41S5]